MPAYVRKHRPLRQRHVLHLEWDLYGVPTASGHTTIRGGIGTFYDSVPLNVYAFRHYPEQVIATYQPDGALIGNPQHYLNLRSEAAAS
jgi:hypothetical protein